MQRDAPLRWGRLSRVKELVGKGYDYDLNLSNDTYYCSEVGVEMLKAADEGSGKPLPWVGTRPVAQLTVNDFVAAPENFAASPDFVMTAANGPGLKATQHIIDTLVLGAKGPTTPRGSEAELKALLPPPPPPAPLDVPGGA